MNYNFFLIILILNFGTYAQSSEKDVYLYSSFADFQNKNEDFAGTFVSYSWSDLGANKIYTELKKKRNKININKYWGFRIGDNLFRFKNGSPKIPVKVIGIKEKVFYVNGYFLMGKLAHGSSSSSRTKDNVFYSNDLESKILDISKLSSNEKNNKELLDIVSCVKKGKKRYGYQAEFNGYMKCIKEHLKVN